MHPEELGETRTLTAEQVTALTPEQRRARAKALESDPNFPWADWVLQKSLPARRASEARSRRNILRNRALLSRLRRDGYWFDTEHRLQAPVTRLPRPRQGAASRAPRSRRTRTRTASAAGRDGPLDGSEGEPPPLAHLRGFLPASVRMVRHIGPCTACRWDELVGEIGWETA